ncbi:hypothetical protein EYB45_00325 [Erythrobacteraceae bacterium CFH 75059]|uniref:hypothetical protein n=1 Tax=Qipengyuania thermophila TaxID=2509361 RepID=UPI0010229CA7|nr:hypothetical protein [Qipengyuania thermophila]TCD06228.1 hypothetical protein EYB45_00325 [Erythrobacteraceae bacterium CFH 75059]
MRTTSLSLAAFLTAFVTAQPLAAQQQAVDASGAPHAAAEGAPTGPEPQICRVQDVTGSHVRKRKVCRTAAEWRRLADDHRAQAQEYVEHGRGGSRGN